MSRISTSSGGRERKRERERESKIETNFEIERERERERDRDRESRLLYTLRSAHCFEKPREDCLAESAALAQPLHRSCSQRPRLPEPTHGQWRTEIFASALKHPPHFL